MFQPGEEGWDGANVMVGEGVLDEPSTFINATPHMTFVTGEKDVAYLKRRYEAPMLKVFP